MFVRRLRLSLAMVAVLAVLLACSGGSSVVGSNPTPPPWQNYPHLFTNTVDRPWLVLLCRFADVPDEPSSVVTRTRQLFGVGGLGVGNVADFYADVSYGAVSFADTRIMGWYTAPFNLVHPGAGSRRDLVRQCAEQVPSTDVSFCDYYGIVMVENVPDHDVGTSDLGQHSMTINGQTCPLAAVVLDPNDLNTSGAGHELGHGQGLDHGWDNSAQTYKNSCGSSRVGEYCDHWDVMGDDRMGVTPGDVAPGGPGLTAPQLLQLGWIPLPRIATYYTGSAPQTFTLTALSHPAGSNPLVAEILGSDRNDLYTVEYRQKDGWDAGIPSDTVLIHEYKVTQDPYSFLQLAGPGRLGGEWLAGSAWTDPTGSVVVKVERIDDKAGTATVSIGYPSLFNNAPVVTILAPANNSTVNAGSQFQLVARAVTWKGDPLPNSEVVWTTNGTWLGNGATLTTALASPGTYTVTVTATDNGQSASSSVTLNVISPPPPSPVPTVQILSPAPNQEYRVPQYGSVQIVLSSQASAGVTQYAWTDTAHLISDSHANDTVTIAQSQVGCGNVTDTITLTVTDSAGQSSAPASVTILLLPQCTG